MNAVTDADPPAARDTDAAPVVSFEIEIEVSFSHASILPTELPKTLGPRRSSDDAKIRLKAETTLQIRWSTRTKTTWFARVTSTWDQQSLRTLLDEFDKYSGEFLQKLDELDNKNVVTRCELIELPQGLNGPRDQVPFVAWTDERRYKSRWQPAWRREAVTSLPSVATLFLIVLCGGGGGVEENALYGALLGLVAIVVNVFAFPFFGADKGLVHRAKG